jgi:5'-nucleotidase
MIPNHATGIVKAGKPSVGTDPNDSHIWYYNGTPSACVQVALDYVFPKFANFSTPDLVLSGPNFGWNLGPFLYTLSGTICATYTAVERGIPGIAFSAGYGVQTPYYDVNTTTKAGLKDPATMAGELAANLAQQLIKNAPKGGRLLPLGYGISVNIPYITSFTNSSCINPPFINTRLTGGADVDQAVYNATSGLFAYGNVVSPGANTCINGDCSLPGETDILNAGCQSSVSVFTVDYDAPLTCHSAPDLRKNFGAPCSVR